MVRRWPWVGGDGGGKPSSGELRSRPSGLRYGLAGLVAFLFFGILFLQKQKFIFYKHLNAISFGDHLGRRIQDI
jgi:hypothetical protein